MAGDRIIIEESPATEWTNNSRWGRTVTFNPAQAIPAWGGIGTTDWITVIEAIPAGSPQLYEVRFGVQWAALAPGVVPNFLGMLEAKITSGVGSATQTMLCDVRCGTAVLVPGGTITAGIRQRGAIEYFIESVSVTVARAQVSLENPTYSLPNVNAVFDALSGYFVETLQLPARSTRLRLSGYVSLKVPYVEFTTATGFVVAAYDAGTYPELMGMQGVPVPPVATNAIVYGEGNLCSTFVLS